MITIGYGDIHPYTSPEMVVAILAMLLASGVFGYTMNSIMITFEKKHEVQNLAKKNHVILRYIKQKQLPINLQSRVRNYLEWLSDQEQVAKSFEQQLIANLSSNLRNEVVAILNGRIVADIPIIMKHFSDSLKSRLIFSLREQSIRCIYL
jgi:hypothetical protein